MSTSTLCSDQERIHITETQNLRSALYSRFLSFLLIEAGFIILAACCLVKPIPIHVPFSLSDSDIKGGFTVIFIIWHSLAAILVVHILLDVFSREWSANLSSVVPGNTDRVSTLTSGFIDQILYFFTPRASGTFRFAFLASLSLLALSKLGPGAITVNIALINEDSFIWVGDLSGVQTGDDQIASRAQFIVQSEILRASLYGLKLPPNTITALPLLQDLPEKNTTIEYDADIAMFKHDCHWEAPQFHNYTVETIPYYFVGPAAGYSWESHFSWVGRDFIDKTYASTITLLRNPSVTGDVLMPPDNVYGLLFTGANTEQMNTSPYNSDSSLNINLGDLPNTPLPSDYGPELSNHETYNALLGSPLVCELHPNVTGGRIRLSNDGTVDIVTSGKPPIGNIPYNSTLKIISDALQGPVRYFETSGQFGPGGTINDVVSYLFFGPNATWSSTAPPIHVPLDISSINTNLDKAMSSAVKAYVDGFKGPELRDLDATYARSNMRYLDAVAQVQTLALVTFTSKAYDGFPEAQPLVAEERGRDM